MNSDDEHNSNHLSYFEKKVMLYLSAKPVRLYSTGPTA